MAKRLWRTFGLAITLGGVLLDQSSADSGLPEFTIGPPEGAMPDAAFDLMFVLAQRIGQQADGLFDPPSQGWLPQARTRLAATIAEADAEAAAVMGPASRGMAEYLARTLWYRQQAEGWKAMRQSADLAVAMERHLSANAVFLGRLLPGTKMAAATGIQTTALEDVLFHLVGQAETERAMGQLSPTRSEDLAFRLAQAAFTGETAMASLRSRRRDPVVFDDYAATFAEVQDLQALMAEVAHMNVLIEQEFPFPDPDGTFDSVNKGIAEVQTRLARLQKDGVDIADALFPWQWSVNDIQRSLRPDEAVVMIVPAGAHVLLFALTDSGFVLRRAGTDQPGLMDQAARIRAAVGWAADRAAVPLTGATVKPTHAEVLRHEAFMAYQSLLQPVEFLIRDRLRLHVVSTARVGLNLPFELLLTAPAPPDADDRDLPWLVRRHAVMQVPTLDLLWLRGREPAPPRGETWYLGFGAPEYALPSQLDRSNWATRILMDLRPLPDSADEVARVAASFGEGRGAAVTGADANEYVLKLINDDGTLAQMTVLHFATHGLVYGDHPDVGEPMLALTPTLDVVKRHGFELGTINAPHPDGALLASEIRQLHLAARLVILSACSTGAIEFDQDGLTSLGTAFLAAGAERVLGTHWPVYSPAAVEIVTGMAAADPQFADPAAALRQTLLTIIDQGGRKSDPAWWAAFSLVGAP